MEGTSWGLKKLACCLLECSLGEASCHVRHPPPLSCHALGSPCQPQERPHGGGAAIQPPAVPAFPAWGPYALWDIQTPATSEALWSQTCAQWSRPSTGSPVKVRYFTPRNGLGLLHQPLTRRVAHRTCISACGSSSGCYLLPCVTRCTIRKTHTYGERWREERRGRHGRGETVWDSARGQILSEDRKDEGGD